MVHLTEQQTSDLHLGPNAHVIQSLGLLCTYAGYNQESGVLVSSVAPENKAV